MPGRLAALPPGGATLVLLLLAGCGESRLPDDAATPAPDIVRTSTAAEALQGVQVAKLDPATLQDAEIRKVIGAGPHCTFHYTASGKPVVAAHVQPDGTLQQGVVKLNHHLVPLQPGPAAGGGAAFVLASGPVSVSVRPLPAAAGGDPAGRRVEADMIFEVAGQLKVGYGGFMSCRRGAPAGLPQ